MTAREDFFLFKSQRLTNPWHFDILNSNYGYIDEFKITKNTVHWHDYFEIEIILDGSFLHILNNQNYSYTRGDVCILNYSDFHTHTLKTNEPISAYNINFDEFAVSDEIVHILLSHDQPLIGHFEEDEFKVLIKEIEDLRLEISQPENPLKLPLISASFTKILITILRKCLNKSMADKLDSIYAPFHKAVSLIKCHFRENLSLTQLSKMVGLTPNYLGSLFKSNLGMTYTEYITELRLKHAKNLLSHSDFSVDYIAQNSGFQSYSYFIQSFKKRYGITPKQYQKIKKSDNHI